MAAFRGNVADLNYRVEMSIKNDTLTLVHGTTTLYRNVGHLSATDAASHPKRNRDLSVNTLVFVMQMQCTFQRKKPKFRILFKRISV